jgi:phosphopantothenoylcysteine decarboxylase/phosphopantothenate--cysteine ligase
VRPLTFEALSGQPVIVGMYERPDYASDRAHRALRGSRPAVGCSGDGRYDRQICPGIGRRLSSTLYLSNTNPVLIAPAMNVEMWNHPATRSNIEILRQRGVHFVDPGSAIRPVARWGREGLPYRKRSFAEHLGCFDR